VTAAQIRDAARLVGAEATAENVLSRTGEVAEIWVAGFIAALEAARDKQLQTANFSRIVPLRAIDEMVAQARIAAEKVSTP
jgi:hypothetical protein